VEGNLLDGGGLYKGDINVCRPVPFIVLKALALDGRGEPKDAYDLVYVLRYYKEGPESVVQEIRQEEREQPSFQHAIATLRNHFGKPEQNGPAKYANFNRSEQNAAIQAYATVQEFLTKLDG